MILVLPEYEEINIMHSRNNCSFCCLGSFFLKKNTLQNHLSETKIWSYCHISRIWRKNSALGNGIHVKSSSIFLHRQFLATSLCCLLFGPNWFAQIFLQLRTTAPYAPYAADVKFLATGNTWLDCSLFKLSSMALGDFTSIKRLEWTRKNAFPI